MWAVKSRSLTWNWVSIDAPTYAVVNKQLRIPFVVHNTLGQDRDVNVSLSINHKQTITKLIHIPAMSHVQENMVWTPSAIGDWTLTLRIPRDTQELISENNEISVPIAVREEQLKVLVIESYPRWEYRYLRNALERDTGVELTCLLFSSRSAQGRRRARVHQKFSECERTEPL